MDGVSHGTGSQVLTLPAKPQTLEVRLPNYASYNARFTPQPGLTQEINVRLLTVAEARQQAMKPRVTAANGQTLVLLTPDGKFSMGSSRREPGRRANEVMRDVTLTRAFYLSTTEVTNAQFKKSIRHDSGVYEDQKLNNDDQPSRRSPGRKPRCIAMRCRSAIACRRSTGPKATK